MRTFEELIEDQFKWAGATKYRASGEGKEVTDYLVEDFGWNGLLWTQAKYTKRFKNQGAEKDLLKIATYQYINWLKLGFHMDPINQQRLRSYVNTTVDTKTKYFSDFLHVMKLYEETGFKFPLAVHPMDQIYASLKTLKEENKMREQSTLFDIFLVCKKVWFMAGFDKAEIHNTDTGVTK